MSRRCSCQWLWVVVSVVVVVMAFASQARAQVATYHMHKESSGSAGGLQLAPASPDAAALVLSSGSFKNAPLGEHLVRTFVATVGAAEIEGVIPAQSPVGFTVWMSKSSNQGVLLPRVKLFLNTTTGVPVCVSTGGAPLTTAMVVYTLTCSTDRPWRVVPTDRFVVWVGVDISASGNGNYAAQVGVEGVSGGRYDSRVVVPLVLSTPSGAVGGGVTISGVGFGAAQGTSTVTFNGVPATPTMWSTRSIGVPVPAGATSGPVVVSVSGGMGVANPFVVTPAVTALSPGAGAVGTPVVISGTSFGAVPGRVTFGGVPASVSSWSDTRVVVTVPVGAVSGPVAIDVGGAVASGGPFDVWLVPEVSALAPVAGPPGTVVTITGVHFGPGDPSDTVTVGGLTAPIVTWSDTQIVVAVPTGAASGPMVVTVHGLPSNGVAFTVLVPDVSAVTVLTPAAGAVLPVGSVSVTASVSGLSAAIASARCNGINATVEGGQVSCVVPILRGRNAVVVHVVDANGQQYSGSALVSGVAAPSALVATPSRLTLAVGDRRDVRVMDDSGRVVTDATWNPDTAGIVTVDAPGQIVAVSPGTAEVVVTAAGLSVRVPVDVVAGEMPAGTTAWAIDQTPGWYQYATTATDAASAAFVTTEVQYDARFLVSAMQVRAFDDDGRQTALIAVPVSPVVQTFRLMGDAMGGLLIASTTATARIFTRFAIDPTDSVAWQHVVGGDVDGGLAQGPDGTIVTLSGRTAFNAVPVVRDPAIVGIDGRTGARRFAITPVAPSFCATAGGVSELSRFEDAITVDTEGNAHAVGIVRDQNSVTPESCGPTALADIYQAARVVHYRIAPDGTSTVVDLYRHAEPSTYVTFRGRSFTTPDDRGGVLAAWEWCTGAQVCRTFARHVNDGALGDVFELPHQSSTGSMVSAQDQSAYYGGALSATVKVDMRTGGVLWQDAAPGAPVAVRADGRVEIYQSGVGRVVVAPASTVATAVGPRVDAPVVATSGSVRVTADRGDISAVVAESFLPDQASFAVAPSGSIHQGGGLQGRGAAPGPYGVFFKGHEIPGTVGLGRHGSLRIVPRNQARWRINSGDIFVFQDPAGLYFATVGAGPGLNHVRSVDTTSACVFGTQFLTNGLNFDTDRLVPPASAPERLRYAPLAEDVLVGNLLARDAAYPDAQSYCWNPYYLNLPFYNSNSYISGLLRAAGVAAPVTPRDATGYLGWQKPVPADNFITAP